MKTYENVYLPIEHLCWGSRESFQINLWKPLCADYVVFDQVEKYCFVLFIEIVAFYDSFSRVQFRADTYGLSWNFWTNKILIFFFNKAVLWFQPWIFQPISVEFHNCMLFNSQLYVDDPLDVDVQLHVCWCSTACWCSTSVFSLWTTVPSSFITTNIVIPIK